MTSKHILIVSTDLGEGGMQRQLSYLLQNYDRNRYLITLALFRSKIVYPIPSDVSVIDLKKKGKLDILFFFKMIILLFDKKYDLIISKIEGTNKYVAFFGGVLRKSRIIFEFRNTGEWKQYKLLGKFFRLFKMKGWRVVCNSQKACDEFISLNSNLMTVHYIPNGIVIEANNVNKTEKSREFVVGFAGRIHPSKNVIVLINALNLIKNELKNATVVIAGKVVDDEYYNGCIQLIQSYKLNDQVKFLGPIRDMREFYKQVDVFVLPSFHEGTPNVLLEAMAMGLPSLASEGANTDSILNSQYVFTTTDAKELAEKLLYLYHLDMDSCNLISENNFKFVENHYSIKSMVNNYADLIDAIV